jgi:hypothetical protein
MNGDDFRISENIFFCLGISVQDENKSFSVARFFFRFFYPERYDSPRTIHRGTIYRTKFTAAQFKLDFRYMSARFR